MIRIYAVQNLKKKNQLINDTVAATAHTRVFQLFWFTIFNLIFSLANLFFFLFFFLFCSMVLLRVTLTDQLTLNIFSRLPYKLKLRSWLTFIYIESTQFPSLTLV